MEKEARQQIHMGLKRHFGSIGMVVSKSGYSRDQVLKVLKGERNNDLILKIASEVLLECEKRRSVIRKKVSDNIRQSIALAS